MFDDLFEPFELEDGPPERRTDEPEPEPEHTHPPDTGPAITCSSCGTANPGSNRHCEACGARLSSDPLPVAPMPGSAPSPGARALTVLAAVVLIAGIAAIIINLTGDDETEPAASSSTTTAPPTTVAFEELIPTTVTASSALGDSFAPENLLDNNPDTEWQDASQRGNGAELTFSFAQPVRIVNLEVVNLQDDERFRLNYRIKGYVITVDDLAINISGELDDDNEPQRIPIGTVGTTSLTIEVRTTYPAQSVDDKPPFDELALADVRFFGSTN